MREGGAAEECDFINLLYRKSCSFPVEPSAHVLHLPAAKRSCTLAKSQDFDSETCFGALLAV